jgi:biopolymer transport protein ExbB
VEIRDMLQSADPSILPQAQSMASLYEIVVSGGPIMIPIGVCSIVALAYAVERFLHLRRAPLGISDLGGEIVAVVRAGGRERGLELCASKPSPLARVLSTALSRWSEPRLEREKAVEEAGLREVRRLNAGLKPLVVVTALAPLLGLLGTVWGMIICFSTVARAQALGQPERLANGISQALITTAAGLIIAIPTQAIYYWFKSRIERFARTAEDLYSELSLVLQGGEERRANP